MYLKSIEIRGFKSFADKTVLYFENGITAVVGPNGSGKSNISDAVRWVLGEQSVKTLRGSKMEDVIFSGTEFRKSMSVAQVSITFDNPNRYLPIDYSEVTITRRLYRSGESEYCINNNQCRLKDIQELLMDTGIGKEGYSIISQGKIDQILSGRQEEKRSLIEEAVGIVKYKYRKEEAEKKLSNTNENIDRLEDIISTYKDRILPLKEQSEKAKEFLILSEKLKINEINIILNSLDKIKDKFSKLNEEIIKVTDGIKEINIEKMNLRVNRTKLSSKLEEMDKENSDKKSEYYKLKSIYDSANSEERLIQDRIQNINDSIAYNTKLSSDINTKIDVCNDEILKINAILESHEADNKHLVKDTIEKENELKSTTIQMEEERKAISELIQTLEKSSSSYMNLKNEISLHQNNIENYTNRLNETDLKIKSLKSLYSQNEENNKRINSLLLEIKNKKEAISDDYNKETNEYNNAKQLLIKGEEKYREVIIQKNRTQDKKDLMISLENSFEGYNKSVKTLMQHINRNEINGVKGKCTVLGEIIKTDKKYEVAIEASIGGAISDIVTEDEDIAKKLIAYLKSHGIGRATFLPLTTIQKRNINLPVDIKNFNGFIGLASDIAKYDNKYSNAIQFILGRTIIAENLESALQIAKKFGYTVKVVTLSGDMVNSGGSLTGGSIANKGSGVIGRKRQIQELIEELNILNEEIISLNILNEELKSKNLSLSNSLIEKREKINSMNLDIIKYSENLKSFAEEKIKIDNSLLNESKNLTEINIEILRLNTELNKFKHEYLMFEKSKEDYTQKIALRNKSLKDKEEAVTLIREEITQLKMKKVHIDEMINGKKNEKTKILKEIEDNTNLKIDFQNSILKSKKEIIINNEKYKNIVTQKSNITDSLNSMEKDFGEYETRKEKVKIDLLKVENIIESCEEELKIKDGEKHKIEINIAKYESEEESLFSRLSEDFSIDSYEDWLKYKLTDINFLEIKNEVSTIKNKISELGYINVGAIEEFKEVSEKYEFLTMQRDDLLMAKDELIKLINEMMDKMKVVFRDNFKKLRQCFNETFSELFKGGTGDLILSDSDELYGDIEITVQPPGKKLQNLNLLSGGEKVLSAIALLFAILKMKPSPFCILDEIEAALDDVNVIKYANFLRKFSKEIQFIVITHRKGTMENSDILYGVTMEEKGISKIVSLDLTN